MNHRRLHLKLSKLISRKEELKMSFIQLNSEVRAGLKEAEDVFASLAIPLRKLVRLKSVEMASEGRSSTITISTDHSQSQDENFMARALTAGNELNQGQKEKLIELMKVLKKVETQVMSSQNNISESLADHEDHLREFVRQAAEYMSDNHTSMSRTDLLQMIQKILKITLHLGGDSFSSMKEGVNCLIRDLQNRMCKPMVSYVNNLKKELKAETCSYHLMKVIKEMEGAIMAKNFELEETRRRARLEEKSKIEITSKWREAEETIRKLEESNRKLTLSLGNLTGETSKTSKPQQEAKEDNLLWDLLSNNKRKRQVVPDLTRPATSSLDNKRVTRSQAKGLLLQSSFMNSLGSSPSATIQKLRNYRS